MLYAPANHLFTISCVSHAALERALQTLAQTPISRFSHTGLLPVPAVFMPPLRRVLNEACMPSPLPDHVLVERAISALCLILTAAGPTPRTSLAARNHQRYVRKVRAYLCDHPGESPGLETLCGVTGVGARTLETAFREVIGLSPLQFSKVRRLNAARHVLANADPEEASVKSVAIRHGFFHLGRFARDYKGLFGESPSLTLAIRCKRAPAVRPFLPFKAEPVEILVKWRHEFRFAATRVEIFIAEDQDAAVRTGTLLGHPKSPGMAQMQQAGG